MKRALALMLVVAVVAATAITVGAATAAPAKKQDTSLSGAGSSFVFPLVSKWIPALGSAYGYNVSYYPIGSGGGIAAITAKTVDFGASDAPLSTDQATACAGCVQIPWALSATSIMYNLPGINCTAARDRPDPGEDLPRRDHDLERRRDHEDQPEVHAAEHEDHAGHRSDNSGTTYNFTDYLSAVSPAWKSKLGVGVRRPVAGRRGRER